MSRPFFIDAAHKFQVPKKPHLILHLIRVSEAGLQSLCVRDSTKNRGRLQHEKTLSGKIFIRLRLFFIAYMNDIQLVMQMGRFPVQ